MKTPVLPQSTEDIALTVIAKTCPGCDEYVATLIEQEHQRHTIWNNNSVIEVIPPLPESDRLEILLQDCIEMDAISERKTLVICPGAVECTTLSCSHHQPHEAEDKCTLICSHHCEGKCLPVPQHGTDHTDNTSQLNDWMTLADAQEAVKNWHRENYDKEFNADRDSYMAAYFYALGRRDQRGEK